MIAADKELIERAGKAANYNLYVAWTDSGYFDGYRIGSLSGDAWNPLADDGDALRLAVEIGLVVSPSRVSIMAWAPGDLERGEVWEPLDGDRFAATRRAIVRAVAEIGRSMP